MDRWELRESLYSRTELEAHGYYGRTVCALLLQSRKGELGKGVLQNFATV